jgi:uncharacterized protein (UPF0332 family)
MPYHYDLLDQALKLVHQDPLNPKQASLRRAVSTAYYAVFHLLIFEAASNWNKPTLHTSLGRAFDHGLMKSASREIANANTFRS